MLWSEERADLRDTGRKAKDRDAQECACHPYCLVITHMVEFLFLFPVPVDSWPPTAIENVFQDSVISVFIYSVNKALCFFLVSVLLAPVGIHTHTQILIIYGSETLCLPLHKSTKILILSA